ncbi:uncharacterized protein [Chelonus insularis]|uniref:uncharacterized protein n=1 Tax=Chelonus insularis TaxID=460826 RepID=UPI0015884FE6|nr:uncharacterized protein LOC118065350 [Chelonus insularis]
MDPNVEPLVYSLFYPHGTKGWHKDISCVNKNKSITRNAYIKYRLAIRNDFNKFLLGRRLFQQWVVDSYVKIEKDRIRYCKNNQKQLRVETYQGLIDYSHKKSNDTNSQIGKMIILPSSFINSPRSMLQLYQDSMAIVRKYGKPDIFLTMTCNPKWLEIEENLLPGQTVADRPDLKFFGDVEAYLDVIEFQKRGLPYMHMLITLKKYCKINTSVLVDKYISAEIPDPTINPKLHNIVMNNMIHGPCGDWCLVNSKCSKKYPKSFVEKTAMDENGYPHYGRKNTNIQYIKRLKSYDFSVNNSLVVPHNQRLLLLFNCHINIGIVSSIRAVKYSYKYIYKGHDAAAFNISNSENIINHDEIKDYLEGRYVGPVEACWRIFNKELQNKSHTVTRLPIHLPNQQSIVVHSTENDESIISALDKASMLLEFFALNSRDSEAHNYIYSEITCHYVFKKTNGSEQSQWHKRQTQFNVIGRATSFDDSKTVNGVTYNTFVDTCLVLGLIEDDDEWKKVMTEAESWMMPHQLRRLFVRILIHCQPLHPEQLWETFKNATSEDFLRQFGANVAYKKAYIQINTLLIIEGSSLNEFSSMEQITDIENSDFDDISPQEHNRIGQYQYNQLNKKQKDFVDHVTYSIDNVNGENNISRCFFVDGPGGSGIAATLLPHGKTVHRTFGMPVPLFSDATSNIKPRSKQYEYLKKCDLFIWDEAPMAPRYALELVDRTLRDIMNNTQLFGGKILALGGDFRQLLPVSTNAPRIANGTLNDSNDYLTVPDDCIADEHCNIVDNLYGPTIRNETFDDFTKLAILAPRNTDVDEINNDVVNLLDATTAKIYKSIDSIDQCDNSDINDAIVPEYVNSLNPPNFPPHEFRLRLNTVVMLVRNSSINEGLCNGTRLLIIDLGNNVLKCKILTGDRIENIFFNRITLYYEYSEVFIVKRRQYAIRLAFAMTINKAQGQTFDKIAIDLRKDVFNHGQLYVAMSRLVIDQAHRRTLHGGTQVTLIHVREKFWILGGRAPICSFILRCVICARYRVRRA